MKLGQTKINNLFIKNDCSLRQMREIFFFKKKNLKKTWFKGDAGVVLFLITNFKLVPSILL